MSLDEARFSALATVPIYRLNFRLIIRWNQSYGYTSIGCSLRILIFIFLTWWRFFSWLRPVYLKNYVLAFSCASRSLSRRILVATFVLYKCEASGCFLEQWPPSCYHFSKTSSQWRQGYKAPFLTVARLDAVWCGRRRLGTFFVLADSVSILIDFS